MDEEKQLIETQDENGNIVSFELFDIVEFEDKEYALLLPAEEADNEEAEVVLMQLSKDGEDYIFETIDDEEEFERVAQYIESLEDEE